MDGTRDAVTQAVEYDPRFRVPEIARSGSASAGKNLGLRETAGEWLRFLDGNDRLESDALEKLYAAVMNHHDCSMTVCEYRFWCDGIPIGVEKRHSLSPRMLSGTEALSEFLNDRTFSSATWANVYRRDRLAATGLQPSPVRRHQDDEWTPRDFCAARRVLISGIVICNYRKWDNSVTTGRSIRNIADNTMTLLDFSFRTALPPQLLRALARLQQQGITRQSGAGFTAANCAGTNCRASLRGTAGCIGDCFPTPAGASAFSRY